jgi:hypothetical protein
MSKIAVELPVSVLRTLIPRIQELANGMEVEVMRLQTEEHPPLPPDIESVPEFVTAHQLTLSGNRDAMIASGNYENLNGLLPEMRPDLKELGFDDPTGYLKTICVVPIIIGYHRSVENPPASWADLADERWRGRISVAAPNILTRLMRFYAYSLFGDKAMQLMANVVPEGLPIDVNLKVDSGAADIGILPLPFTRGSRENNLVTCWPEEGALSISQVLVHKKGSFEATRKISEFLLSDEVQRYMSETGMLVPVNPNAPLPPEVVENGLNFYWKGWDWFLKGINSL